MIAPTTPIGSRTTSELPTFCSQVNWDVTSAIEPNAAMGSPTWTSWERTSGMPTSWVIRSARDSIWAPSASLTLVRMAVRSATGVADQAGKAAAAAATARSMSSRVPSGTDPMTSSVVESITSIDPDPEDGTQAPPMYNLSRTIAVMVGMVLPS